MTGLLGAIKRPITLAYIGLIGSSLSFYAAEGIYAAIGPAIVLCLFALVDLLWHTGDLKWWLVKYAK